MTNSQRKEALIRAYNQRDDVAFDALLEECFPGGKPPDPREEEIRRELVTAFEAACKEAEKMPRRGGLIIPHRFGG